MPSSFVALRCDLRERERERAASALIKICNSQRCNFHKMTCLRSLTSAHPHTKSMEWETTMFLVFIFHFSCSSASPVTPRLLASFVVVVHANVLHTRQKCFCCAIALAHIHFAAFFFRRSFVRSLRTSQPGTTRHVWHDEKYLLFFVSFTFTFSNTRGGRHDVGGGTRRREAYRIINREFSEPTGIVSYRIRWMLMGK